LGRAGIKLVKRGEIWTAADGPDYAGKPRPVLILQEDSFYATGSVTICGLTTHGPSVDLIRPEILPTAENNLREVSHVMVDKITTVSRTKLGERIGRLKRSDLPSINKAIALFLGLASPSQ
jgi:mRNA interferase MazF